MGKNNHKASPFLCGQCKQGFGSEQAVRMHISDAHPSIHRCGIFKCIDRVDGPEYDDEPSFADRAIEASLAMAMGEPTDDAWLLGE